MVVMVKELADFGGEMSKKPLTGTLARYLTIHVILKKKPKS